tara:strand:- start:398 stop:1945 length:1548 start_codon:yes stop_codon:yes gene_type:complete
MDLIKEIEKVHFNIKAKNYEAAIEKCNKLIRKFPNNSYIHNLCGLALQQFKRINNSIKYFEKAIDLDPKNISAKNNLANTLKILGKMDLAERLYKEILTIEPNHLKCLNNYGNLKQLLNDYNKAIELYEKALKIDDKNVTLLMSLANAYQGIGKFKEALKKTEVLIDHNKYVMSAHKLKSGIINYKNDKKHLNEMVEISNKKDLSNSQKIDLFFAIGKAYEDIEEYQKSYNFISKANKLKRESINFKIQDEIEHFQDIIDTFEKLKDNIEFENQEDKNIIFICGMPRSGTTLVEQIIASHKNVTGAGELIYLRKAVKENFYIEEKINLKNLQEDILTERTKLKDDYYNLIKLHNYKTKFITDKAPQNFKWIGFIRIFFPNCKIIHCSRNPKDICLSIYKNSFASTDMNWSYDQEDIANYFNLYRKLMEFWKTKYKNTIYNIEYEKLILNKSEEIQKILNFCNLDYDDNCFNHHKSKKTPIKTVSVSQARKPIYKNSINKSEFYQKNLNHMFSLIK